MKHTTVGTIAIAGVLAAAGAAMGQNALGDGTALDRNLQVGSGGRNTRVRDFDQQVRFNNAVIGGTAAGGKHFHGNIAYSPSRDFAVSLPSNDLYTFRRDTAQSALATYGVRGSDALRYQFAVTTGQALPSALAGATGVVPRTFTAAPAPTRSSSSSALRSTADFLVSQAVRPTLVGYRADDTGVTYTASASPLLGVTWYPLEQPKGLEADLSANAPKAGEGPQTNSLFPKPSGLTGLEATAIGLPTPLEIAGLGRKPSTDELKKPVSPLKVKSESYTKVLDAFRDSYSQRTGTPKATDPLALEDPNAPWRRDLDTLRDALRSGDRPVPEGERPARPEEEKDKDKPAPREGPMPIPGADPEKLITPPEDNAPKTEDFLSAQMVQILKDAGVRIDTFRPAAPTVDQAAYAAHMQAGQTALAEGRFFDAEDRFVRAMSAMPADPMAAIGRVHGQLGAGLYLSAASNLRQVMRDHPELSAARFNVTLIPGDARSQKIAEQLRIEIGRASTRLGRDAGLLLAYLGRIRGDAAMRDEGLAAWKERIESDDATELALYTLLSKVWSE